MVRGTHIVGETSCDVQVDEIHGAASDGHHAHSPSAIEHSPGRGPDRHVPLDYQRLVQIVNARCELDISEARVRQRVFELSN